MFISSRLRIVTYLGSVKREGNLGQGSVSAQMAFPLHTSEISEKSETGRMSQSQPNRHISSRFNFFCTGGV